jgi:hypothetical protein
LTKGKGSKLLFFNIYFHHIAAFGATPLTAPHDCLPGATIWARAVPTSCPVREVSTMKTLKRELVLLAAALLAVAPLLAASFGLVYVVSGTPGPF